MSRKIEQENATKNKVSSVNLLDSISDNSDLEDSIFEGYEKLETKSRI